MDAELSARFAAEVDWPKVVDPYTPWQHGPDLLERVWSPDARTADDAHADLHVACCGDGSSVLPAAVEVLPFLVRAAGDPDVRVRPQILDTLAVLGRAGNAARPTAPGPKPGGWRPTAPAAWPAAWYRATDALLPGLADGDEAVRAGVAAVLAQATGRADDLVDRLRSRLEDEPEQPRVAPALADLVRICPPGGAPPTIVEAVELLAEVAAADPPAATAVAPRVRHLLDTDERPVRHDQWRAVLSDDALLAAVRTVVGAAQAAGA